MGDKYDIIFFYRKEMVLVENENKLYLEIKYVKWESFIRVVFWMEYEI